MIDIPFEACGKEYKASFGFLAMAAAEDHFDEAFGVALQRIFPTLSPEDMRDEAKVAKAGLQVRFGDLGALFGTLLLKHHGAISKTELADIIDDIGIHEATRILGDAVRSRLAQGGSDDTAPLQKKSRAAKTG